MTWRVEKHGAAAVVVFERPPENLMSYLLLDELDALLAGIATDEEVTVVILTGGIPGYFVGHADTDDVQQLVDARPGPGDPGAGGRALDRLAVIPQPVIAAINGQAWGGGCELALACLMRIASRLAEALAWVAPIAAQPRHTVIAAKRVMVDGGVMTLRDGLENEQRIFRSTLASPESRRMFGAAGPADPEA